MPRQTVLDEPAILQAALEGLEVQRARTEEAIAVIRTRLGRRPPGRPRKTAATAGPDTQPAKKKRRISAEGRKRIIEATRRRWARYRKARKAAMKASR
jgi:hypothetical protein